MSSTNPKVDFFFNKEKKWKAEIELLRTIIITCDLEEELKWGVACYSYEGANIVLIHTFKEYCAILFFKGVLMADPKSILIQQTENVQAARQIRFTNLKEIVDGETDLKAYVQSAIEIEKSGKKVPLKSPEEFKIAVEFQKALDSNKELNEAFKRLTPGRQRAYLLYFNAPKQAATRESRVEKFTPHILNGKGLND